MSHFTCLIIGENPEDLLTPYDESIEVVPYVCKDAKTVKREVEDYIEKASTGKAKWSDKKAEDWKKHFEGKSFKEIAEDYYGQKLDKDGNLLSTYNPDSKWDWYELGGRWAGHLKLKTGATGTKGEAGLQGMFDKEWKYPEGYVDQAKFGDIDFEGMEKDELEKASKSYDEAIDKLNKGEIKSAEFTYDIKSGETKVEYLERRKKQGWVTFAFITPDGIWHEEAERGWWGMTKNDRKTDYQKEWEKMVGDLKPDTLLSVFDLHI